MNSKLEKELVEKYPKFFDYLKEYKGDMILPMQFGIECGDGWYWLLDNLMESIQRYIDGNAYKSRIKNRYVRFFTKNLDKIIDILPYKHFKFLRKSLRKFLNYVVHHATWEKYEAIAQVEAVQIKEKFGGLRFYTHGGDDLVQGMIWLAESMSYNICEECGSTNNVTQTKGWIISMCEDCMTRYKNKKVDTQLKIKI